MKKHGRVILGMALIGGTMLSVATGCVSLKAPDQVYFDGGRRVADPAEVPPTSSMPKRGRSSPKPMGKSATCAAKSPTSKRTSANSKPNATPAAAAGTTD
jgi:hypothetical protein